VIVLEAVKTPTLCVFAKMAEDYLGMHGGSAGWTNFEIKMHKLVGGRLYLLCEYMNKYILVFVYSVI
jgi:hypothetical protein